jgi:hypothetical protein
MKRSLAAAGLAFALLASPALSETSAPTGVAGLLQKSEADVRARLGDPQIARREAGGAMWTYRGETCALFVFFKAQGREGLRVSGAAAGPRQRGQANPNVDACIAATAKG